MTSPHDTITVDAIRTLVHAFYADIRRDPELGPVFERVVGASEGGWPEHLDKLTKFWSAVLLHIAGYEGNPRIAHLRVHDIRPDHFPRWLALWEVHVRRVFTEAPAEDIIGRAHAIGFHLSRAQFGDTRANLPT